MTMSQTAATCSEGRSSRHRAFARRFVIASACLLAAVAAMNVLVDPYDMLGVRLLPASARSDRLVKTEMLARTSPAPDVLILGSSRTLSLSPRTVHDLTGQTALNLGISSCRAEGPLLMLRYAEAVHKLPKAVIVGIDVEAFHDHLPPDRRWNHVPAVRDSISELSESSYKVFFNDLAEILSLHMAMDSLRSLRHHFAGSGQPELSRLRDDGTAEYPLWQDMKDRGVFDLRARVEATVGEYRHRYRGYNGLCPWRKERFSQFLQLCRDHGIGVTVFVTTLHPAVEADLRERTAYGRLKDDLVAYLDEMRRQYGCEVYDLSSPASYGGDDRHFWDGAHIDSTNGDKLLAFILAPKGPKTAKGR